MRTTNPSRLLIGATRHHGIYTHGHVFSVPFPQAFLRVLSYALCDLTYSMYPRTSAAGSE